MDLVYKSKIKRMDKTITRLQEENKLLREELRLVDRENINNQINLAMEMYDEYYELCDEMRDIQQSYNNLISQMKKELKEMQRRK